MAVLTKKRCTKRSSFKKNVLSTYFDSLDLGVDAIDEWGEFQRALTEKEIRKDVAVVSKAHRKSM